ncbi:MAG: hypothetical protein P8Y91_04665 [Desulfuromonadales bacterium]
MKDKRGGRTDDGVVLNLGLDFFEFSATTCSAGMNSTRLPEQTVADQPIFS